MSKFELDQDLLSERHHPRQIAVAIQTRRNQRRALKEVRTPKCFRSVHSRAVRFSASV